jgi:hypothetical protein
MVVLVDDTLHAIRLLLRNLNIYVLSCTIEMAFSWFVVLKVQIVVW